MKINLPIQPHNWHRRWIWTVEFLLSLWQVPTVVSPDSPS